MQDAFSFFCSIKLNIQEKTYNRGREEALTLVFFFHQIDSPPQNSIFLCEATETLPRYLK